MRRRWIVAALLLAVAGGSACGDEAEPELDPALIRAAERGDSRRVDQLLDRGADVHARDADGRTALTAAAYGTTSMSHGRSSVPARTSTPRTTRCRVPT